MWKERSWPNFETLCMGLNGGKNYMQICCYEYFQDMQGLVVTLKAKLFLFSGVPRGVWGVQTPPEIPTALQNRAKLNPTVKAVKNC